MIEEEEKKNRFFFHFSLFSASFFDDEAIGLKKNKTAFFLRHRLPFSPFAAPRATKESLWFPLARLKK